MQESIKTLSMWDTEVTKEQTKLNGKTHYTVRHSAIVQKDGTLPRTIVLLDAPAEDRYILFGNPDKENGYYSRDYASRLSVVDFPEPEELEAMNETSWLSQRFMTSL